MDAKKLSQALMKCKDDIIKEVNDNLPRKVGVMAVNHFRQNFRNAGFMNGGNHPWKTTQRQLNGGSESAYSPLTSRRNHLMMSTTSEAGKGVVSIRNSVKYAAIHNEGGTIPITKKMKGYAWSKVYSLGGRGKSYDELNADARMWFALATTKKDNITIPQRQFIGESLELTAKVDDLIRKAILDILNS
jgi:phage gpG-like protein